MIDHSQLHPYHHLVEQWRDLGCYCYFASGTDQCEWRFYGSRDGYSRFLSHIDSYITNPGNDVISEHEHFGPYMDLKIMTADKPCISEDYIAGTIENLTAFRNLIEERLTSVNTGGSFCINSEYGIDNTAGALFFVMDDGFDPASMDNFLFPGK